MNGFTETLHESSNNPWIFKLHMNLQTSIKLRQIKAGLNKWMNLNFAKTNCSNSMVKFHFKSLVVLQNCNGIAASFCQLSNELFQPFNKFCQIWNKLQQLLTQSDIFLLVFHKFQKFCLSKLQQSSKQIFGFSRVHYTFSQFLTRFQPIHSFTPKSTFLTCHSPNCAARAIENLT